MVIEFGVMPGAKLWRRAKSDPQVATNRAITMHCLNHLLCGHESSVCANLVESECVGRG
jgi:hypothetical protein